MIVLQASYIWYRNFQDKEIHILLEDQQKINQFARLNNRLEEFKDDITAKKTEIQTLEDASTDMMMLEDDDEKIPYQIGEVFVSMTQVNIPCPASFWKIGTNFSDTSRTVTLWISHIVPLSANHVGGGSPSTNKTAFIQCIIHCYQRIDLPVKKGTLLIYGCAADLSFFFLNTYLWLLVYTNKRRYVFDNMYLRLLVYTNKHRYVLSNTYLCLLVYTNNCLNSI